MKHHIFPQPIILHITVLERRRDIYQKLGFQEAFGNLQCVSILEKLHRKDREHNRRLSKIKYTVVSQNKSLVHLLVGAGSDKYLAAVSCGKENLISPPFMDA